MVRASHSAPQLVQLSQPQFVGTVNDDGVGTGDIDSGLDNGGTDQHIETLVVKVGHDFFQFAFAHLAVCDINPCLRYQFFYHLRRFANALDLIVQIIDLPAT